MTFLDFLFKKQQKEKQQIENKVFHDYDQEITLQYQKKHIIYKKQQGLILYKHVISPIDGGNHFPEGYFDVKTVALSENDQKEIHRLIDTAISQLSFTDQLDLLPVGASHEALIKCKKNTGEYTYYSNCRLNGSGFSVQKEPIPSSFLELFNTLINFCEFVPLVDYAALESSFVQDYQQDTRYFEETLWVCENCSAGNLMEHHCCIKCGTLRPW